MEAAQSLRTPRAAGIAGVLFALLMAMALVLLRLAAASPLDGAAVSIHVEVALGLVPFAGITFLWMIGVVRDRVGAREDRFLATVSLSSGVLFVAMLFAASAVATGGLAAASGLPADASSGLWVLSRRIAAVLLNTYAMRMAAVFMISTSTIGLRTGFVPRWIVFCGYAIALVLLAGIHLTLWVELLFPAWILVLSVDILVETFRESSALQQAAESEDIKYRMSA